MAAHDAIAMTSVLAAMTASIACSVTALRRSRAARVGTRCIQSMKPCQGDGDDSRTVIVAVATRARWMAAGRTAGRRLDSSLPALASDAAGAARWLHCLIGHR